MSTAVWKFPVEAFDIAEVRMPQGAKILTAQVQNGGLQVWAQCDPEAPLVTRYIGVAGTGHPRDDLNDATYIGTVQLFTGQLVFHVFDMGE